MSDEIIFECLCGVNGEVGVITLARPQSLNALTFNMLQQLTQQLVSWEQRQSVKAVVIRGEGKAFCAGGDIKSLYSNRGLEFKQQGEYFACEYQLNAMIYHYSKPFIAFLDGITMGGGCGISLHGSHPVATPNLKLAMPETRIGLFPDVGMSYHLTRCPDYVGWYLALTGRDVDADMALALGLVNCIVPSHALDAVVASLLQQDWQHSADEVVSQCLQAYAMPPNKPPFHEYDAIIARCFSQVTVEEVMQALELEGCEWASQTLTELQQRSPTSLKVTFEQFIRASQMDFDQVIKQDLYLVRHFLRSHDLFEGIRAAVIDKDQRPHWHPSQMAEVGVTDVKEFFAPIE